jgi:predicted phosphodiesterase
MKNELDVLRKQNAKLQKQVEMLHKKDTKIIHNYSGEYIRFGVVSDTQLGSLYERIDFLNLAYEIFKKEGIKNVYHAGDLLDGEKMYRGQEYETHKHGFDSQIDYCQMVYPKLSGIKTHFITGNHDLSFYKNAGADVGKKITRIREDMVYLGTEEADVILKNRQGQVILRVSHPGKGTAYALSYHPQKYIESLTGGKKPHIVLMGHYHKSEFLFYRNIHLIQTGCLQSQTPFMRRQNIAAMTGFWLVELMVDGGSLIRCKTEWFPKY